MQELNKGKKSFQNMQLNNIENVNGFIQIYKKGEKRNKTHTKQKLEDEIS